MNFASLFSSPVLIARFEVERTNEHECNTNFRYRLCMHVFACSVATPLLPFGKESNLGSSAPKFSVSIPNAAFGSSFSSLSWISKLVFNQKLAIWLRLWLVIRLFFLRWQNGTSSIPIEQDRLRKKWWTNKQINKQTHFGSNKISLHYYCPCINALSNLNDCASVCELCSAPHRTVICMRADIKCKKSYN